MVSLLVIAWVIVFCSLFWAALLHYENTRLTQKVNTLTDNYVQLGLQKGYFVRKGKYIRDDELKLFIVLQQLYGDRYEIFPQVRIVDLIDVKSGFRDHDNLYQAIGQKSVDFAFMTKDKLIPELVIELNGEYHGMSSTKNKDAAKEALFEFAGIPVLSIIKQSTYNTDELKHSVDEKLPANL